MRKAHEPGPSEITPQALYQQRREFVRNAGLGALTAAAVGGSLLTLLGGSRGTARDEAKPEVPARALPDAARRRHALQQLLRVWLRQARACRARSHAAHAAVDGARGWRGEKAAHARHRRADRTLSARGARVPHALRGGLVDGHPLARLSA